MLNLWAKTTSGIFHKPPLKLASLFLLAHYIHDNRFSKSDLNFIISKENENDCFLRGLGGTASSLACHVRQYIEFHFRSCFCRIVKERFSDSKSAAIPQIWTLTCMFDECGIQKKSPKNHRHNTEPRSSWGRPQFHQYAFKTNCFLTRWYDILKLQWLKSPHLHFPLPSVWLFFCC